MNDIIDSINAHLRAAEVANLPSVVGELNFAMSLARNLPSSERWVYVERAKDIAIARGVPFDYYDL